MRRRPPPCRALPMLLAVLTGCAQLPRVDLRAFDTPPPRDEAAALARMQADGERIAGKPFLDGNAVALLVNGPRSYAAMEAAIRGATTRIDMEAYEFRGAEAGRIAELLLMQRARGVQVHLIYDAFGSLDLPPSLLDRLRRGGVQTLEFNPLRPNGRVPLDLNRRDHRKLLVVDATVAITGGVNIDGVYRNRPRPEEDDDPERMAWRDTDIRIQGPAVAQFQQLFLQTWREQNGPPLDPPPPTPARRVGNAPVQAIAGVPDEHRPTIYVTLLMAISLARRSVHLTTGYFAPPPEMARALEGAARRGVDVRIVVPGHSDSTLAMAAGRSAYGALLAAGVRIFERQGVVLHAKTATIDGAWCTVGSSNLDWRSVLLNNEIDAVILDRWLAEGLEALFRRDVAASREIDRARWAARPLPERVEEWGARLVEYFL